MSNSTVRYRFEHRLHDWAAQFAQQLTGAPCGFFVGLRDDGSVRRVYLAHPDRPLDGEQKQLLAQRHPSWFLYFPYPEEGRGYLEWLGLPQALYFDGNISRLYAPAIRRSDAGFPMGPIVGVVEPR